MRIGGGLLFSLMLGMAQPALARPAARAADKHAAEARGHFEAGMAHFNLQEYDAAIPEFEAAYRIKPDPVQLYNLAQAHRLANHAERALYFYRAFLRAQPDTPVRAEVEARIHALEAPPPVTTEAPPATASPTTAPATTTPPAPDPTTATATRARPDLVASVPPPRARTPLYKKWWLWTAVGVVVAGAAVGATVALVPKNAAIPGNTDGNIPVSFH